MDLVGKDVLKIIQGYHFWAYCEDLRQERLYMQWVHRYYSPVKYFLHIKKIFEELLEETYLMRHASWYNTTVDDFTELFIRCSHYFAFDRDTNQSIKKRNWFFELIKSRNTD